jgi:hypothetical protein
MLTWVSKVFAFSCLVLLLLLLLLRQQQSANAHF